MLLNQFKPTGRDLVLPNTVPARAFRYKHALNWEVDLLTLGIGAKVGRGSWELSLVSPESRTIFKQKVTLELLLVSLGVPGLSLFTWNFQKETIETSIAGGESVSKTTIGPYLRGGTPESEQGDMQPASGEGATDLTATIIADWHSPIYLQNVPAGTKLFVKRDTWGFGPSTVEYGWAFEDGTAGRLVDTTQDIFGAVLSARLRANGTVEAGRSWPYFAIRNPGGSVKGTEPSIVVMADGRQYVGVLTAEGYVEYLSRNSGWTWERAQYADEGKGYGTIPKVLWGSGVQVPRLARLGDNRISIAVAGGELRARLLNKVAASVVVVGKAVAGDDYSIESDARGKLTIFNSKGEAAFASNNSGTSWHPATEAESTLGVVSNA